MSSAFMLQSNKPPTQWPWIKMRLGVLAVYFTDVYVGSKKTDMSIYVQVLNVCG